MPLPPPNLPSVSRVVGKWTAAGSGATAVNVWHVLSGGIPALDVFNRFSTAVTAFMWAAVGEGCRLNTLSITRLDNSTASSDFATVGTIWDGTTPGEHSPQVAMLVKYTTGFRGLASVGHTYVPFIAEAAQENGHLVGTISGAITDAWVGFVNTLETQDIPLQVVSLGRADHPTLPDAPAANHSVTAVTVDLVLATQRNRQSRLRG